MTEMPEENNHENIKEVQLGFKEDGITPHMVRAMTPAQIKERVNLNIAITSDSLRQQRNKHLAVRNGHSTPPKGEVL